MSKVTLSTGREVALDGNLEALFQAIHREILVKSGFRCSFDDVASEMSFVISQMEEENRDQYLFLSLGALLEQFVAEKAAKVVYSRSNK